MPEPEFDSDPAYLAATAPLRELQRRVRRGLVLSRGLLYVLLAVFLYLALRFPFAAVPGVVGALIGYRRSQATRLRAHQPMKGPDLREEGGPLRWALIAGAVGYAAFASAGVGVPAPEAPLPWRLFGGAVFGALAGVGSWWAVGVVRILATSLRHDRRAA